LPISTDPNGIPAREAPLGNADGADAVGDAVPLAAEAHGAALPSNIPPPTVSPPPSYVLTPDIPVDAFPPAEHVEASIPVGSVSIGLMPGEVSSVAPSGMPVGPTDAPGCEPPDMPSGEVAAMPGVGTLIPPIWAKAALQPSVTMTAVIQRRVILVLRVGARRLQAASWSGGAMNSGPTGLVMVLRRMRSISAIPAASMCQPIGALTEAS
jgi:hypothetical protein